jgi:hypothetical protein
LEGMDRRGGEVGGELCWRDGVWLIIRMSRSCGFVFQGVNILLL